MLIFWLICSFFTYGIVFAYLQEIYKDIACVSYWSNAEDAFLIAVLGPIGLIMAIYKSEYCKYGMRWL